MSAVHVMLWMLTGCDPRVEAGGNNTTTMIHRRLSVDTVGIVPFR
ncbi:hypothetical protein ACWGJT_36230 [Streptomyces xantholiticus]